MPGVHCYIVSCYVLFLLLFVVLFYIYSVILESMEEIKTMLFISNPDGHMEPACNLYSDISGGVWKKVGVLFASSIVMNGPAPNFMAPWMFQFIIGGIDKVLESLPQTLSGESPLVEMYNKV